MAEQILKSVGIIMDGNRRWAREKSLNVFEGHTKGAEVLEIIAKYCNKIGIKYLSVYAFSTENWNRTEQEVKWLMNILNNRLDKAISKISNDNIKIKFIGGRERLNTKLLEKIKKLEEKTENNTGMILNICFNYGGRDEIVRTTKKLINKVLKNEIKLEDIDEKVFSENVFTAGQEDPDLIIRTSGEKRISGFLTWQTIYSEFLFIDKYWPEFTEKDIDNAIEEYSRRQRRKGK